MRFSLIAVPALAAVTANAAAIAAEDTTPAPAGPDSPKNTDAAMSAVISGMMKQSPGASSSHSTIYVTGKPAATGSPLPKTTTTKKITTTTKKATTTKKTTTKKANPTKLAKVARQATVNDACAAQPIYYNYAPAVATGANDTVALKTFLADTTFLASSNAGTAPTGYTWTYKNFYASQQRAGYMFMTQMASYNQTACAAICDNTPYCKGFSIYYERSPKLAPAVACPKPDAFASIRCTFYDGALSSAQAVNFGEWRQSFPVVITGANGYNKN